MQSKVSLCFLRLSAVTLFSFGLRAADLIEEDWPKFLGPQGNNVSRETGLLQKWPAEGPPVLWDKAVGTGYSAPSVLGKRLVLHHRVGDEEIVQCFDATTG